MPLVNERKGLFIILVVEDRAELLLNFGDGGLSVLAVVVAVDNVLVRLVSVLVIDNLEAVLVDMLDAPPGVDDTGENTVRVGSLLGVLSVEVPVSKVTERVVRVEKRRSCWKRKSREES